MSPEQTIDPDELKPDPDPSKIVQPPKIVPNKRHTDPKAAGVKPEEPGKTTKDAG